MEEPDPNLSIPEFVKWVNSHAPVASAVWWLTPNEAFEGRTPMELVEVNERAVLVSMVYYLNSGMPT